MSGFPCLQQSVFHNEAEQKREPPSNTARYLPHRSSGFRVKLAQERAHLVLALPQYLLSALPFLARCTPIWLLSEVPDKGLVNKYLKSMKSPKEGRANQR